MSETRLAGLVNLSNLLGYSELSVSIAKTFSEKVHKYATTFSFRKFELIRSSRKLFPGLFLPAGFVFFI